MKIAVYEYGIKNHSVMLLNWAEICQCNHWSLTIFTTEECYLQIKDKLEQFECVNEVIITKKMSIINSFKLAKKLSCFDKVVINSIYSAYFSFYLLSLIKVDVYLTIHNVNKWFIFDKTDYILLQKTTKTSRVKNIFKVFLAKRIKKNFVGFIVNSQNMMDYLSSNFNVINCEVIPFSTKERDGIDIIKKTSQSNNDNINVIYPGVVDLSRKNYDSFFKLAQQEPSCNFYLLGRLPDNFFDTINQSKLGNVFTFENYIPQRDFDKIMNDADLLFSDINVEFNGEVYGQTKDSGVSYLMSEYCIPLLVNDDFSNLSHLNSATLYFKNDIDLLTNFKTMKNKEFRINKTQEILKIRQSRPISLTAKKIESFLKFK